MKVCVLNGSPKGKNSITLQTVLYLQQRFPSTTFNIVHVGQRIRTLEQNPQPALEAIREADLLLFAYPVYTFLAPSQLHRFIALLKASGEDLSGKYATQLTTSKHFYDVTAHRYIQDNCMDMGMKYIRGLSADMDDLLSPRGQREAESFWGYVLQSVRNELWERPSRVEPRPVPPYTASLTPRTQRPGHDIVIVSDARPEDTSLLEMIRDFQAALPWPSRVVSLRDFPFSGGCLGCFHCAATGSCIYKDGFDRFLREEIQKADAIIYAFTIQDHSMGPLFKQYDDRQFCNGHRTVTEGTPVGYLIRGDYPVEENLRMVLEARAQVGHNLLVGTATNADEIKAMIGRLSYGLEKSYLPPRDFYGVGGMKIFRDLIYVMRGLMKADHEFYKAHGVYDFPQKQKGRMLGIMLLGTLISRPSLQKKLGGRMTEGMLAPYRKVLRLAAQKKKEKP